MFGKKEKPKRQNRPAGSLAQYGIFEVPETLGDLGGGNMDDMNDDDLEAELAALTLGDDNGQRKKKAPRKPISDANLDAMINESMKDVDEEVSDGEDDPELLNELKMITGDESPPKSSPEVEVNEVIEPSEETETKEDNAPSEETLKLLQDRLTIYKIAERKAKEENESGRARRFKRGIKNLEELLSSAQAGESIDEADIPPPLPASATEKKIETVTDDAAPAEEVNAPAAIENDGAAETTATKTVDEESLQLLKSRQREYQVAAVAWKRTGNMKEALQHVQIVKQFDLAIAAVSAGEPIDLSDMPPAPNTPTSVAASTAPVSPEKEESENQQHAAEIHSVGETQRSGPENLESALKERLEVYRRTQIAAEAEGNSSKSRRYLRICKQFEDAIKLHVRGKLAPLDKLPTPPGFPPLFVAPESSKTAQDDKPTPAQRTALDPEPPEKKMPPSAPKAPTPPSRAQTGKKMQVPTSRAEKQMLMLQQRQREFKEAALAAKKDRDLELARDYLRQAKRIQPLIDASIAGLPVDMNSVPLSPLAKIELSAHGITGGQMNDNFMLVSSEDCLEEATGTDEQIYDNLESQLVKQIKWCLSTRDHSKELGDVPGYNRWERLALSYTRDLDMLRVRKRDLRPPPQHHYETKTYAIVQSCTDLGDGDVEISVIRGINYSKETDSYVLFEFPFPSDSPPTDRTSTIRGSNNPEYEQVFPLTGIIERTSRQCQRAFKRHTLKCQVWAKGCSLNPILCCTHPRGFFRSDTLLGTVTVKLQPLETQCILHDSFPLMDGRKPTGGKLELKIRLRNPILTKQIEQITDKWLTIDQ